ncbi:MAG TPA: hotdog fold thioesterase [Euzebya sp.]|nr:hotdog fold thioesterase [Euzebya sp.]
MTGLDTPPPLATRPRFPETHADVAAELQQLFTDTPMYATLGIRLLHWGPGWAQLALSTGPALGNLAGSLHGGATFTLADAAFEVACNSHGRMAVALETTCHYHHPAPLAEEIRADAWEVARGGRTASYRLQVSDMDGRVLVSYMALAYRTSRWHVAADRLPDGWD